jgi:hypothetical protein
MINYNYNSPVEEVREVHYAVRRRLWSSRFWKSPLRRAIGCIKLARCDSTVVVQAGREKSSPPNHFQHRRRTRAPVSHVCPFAIFVRRRDRRVPYGIIIIILQYFRIFVRFAPRPSNVCWFLFRMCVCVIFLIFF